MKWRKAKKRLKKKLEKFQDRVIIMRQDEYDIILKPPFEFRFKPAGGKQVTISYSSYNSEVVKRELPKDEGVSFTCQLEGNTEGYKKWLRDI